MLMLRSGDETQSMSATRLPALSSIALLSPSSNYKIRPFSLSFSNFYCFASPSPFLLFSSLSLASMASVSSVRFQLPLKLKSSTKLNQFTRRSNSTLEFLWGGFTNTKSGFHVLRTCHLRISCAAKPETVDKVCEVVRKQLALPPESELTPESTFSALGADSLDTVEIVMSLEEEFGMKKKALRT